ncbi:unnamed protein product [Rotaria socialis]|uniref:Uncharacterized protein n=2 Tax=Rotaria socialis TaxID=392032 RepID=A0A817NIM6_9BILA|nr:unnamed protein product [Rotaria socialis]
MFIDEFYFLDLSNKIMNDAAPSNKPLYRWEKRTSALDRPPKPTKHDDIKSWLRQVENASSNAVESVFPRSSSRQTGKVLANQAAVYAKTTDTTYTEARAILDEWMTDKLRLDAGLNDSYDEEIVQSNVRSVKQACNLSFDDDDQLEFLQEPKDLFTFQDPSVYYETHDETDLVKDILHDLRSKDLLTRQQLVAMENSRPTTVDIQTKIEERHRQVKENHEKMQKEREVKRKQTQAKKEAEAQARLLVLKEERERALKAKHEEELIERHVVEIRKEMHEKRIQDDEQRKHQREYDHAKIERTKAEQERARKEEELQKLKQTALKEQNDFHEKRVHALVDDFIRMKALTVLQKHFSAWLNVVLERRLQMGRAGALSDWKLLFQSFHWWRSVVRTRKLEEENEIHMTQMKVLSRKMQQASVHYERTILRKSMIVWQIYIRNERIAKNLKHEQELTKKKIDSFLDAASTGKLWANEQQTSLTTATTNSAATTTRQQSQQIKARKVSVTTRTSSLSSRPHSAVTFGDKSSLPTRTQSDVKLDDFFQAKSSGNEEEEEEEPLRATSAGVPLVADTRRMHLDFDALSSSDEDLTKKKTREKRIRHEMAEHKATSRVMHTFENRYNTQMKMLKEQNRLLKDQQLMIEELKYKQEQQVLHNQISNLEVLKAQQSELEEKQRKQLVNDRRHATALIQAHNRGEIQKQLNTSRLDLTLTDRPTTRNDMILLNMEERARRRNALKTEREAKRRAIEDEKLAKVQQMMEEKARQEEEEKRLKIEEAREKRRVEKERELEKKQFEERLIVLNEKADIHCRLFRMRYYGLSPLKKLILIRHQQMQTAAEHHNYIVAQRTFNVWYATLRQDIEIKTNRAIEFYKSLLYRRYFTSWQRYKHQSEIAEERAEKHYVNHLMINMFKTWKDYTQTEVIRLWRLADLAKEHDVKRIFKNTFIIWRQYPMERRKERDREKRLAEMRLKVKDLLPDFRGTESSSLNGINGSDNKT